MTEALESDEFGELLLEAAERYQELEGAKSAISILQAHVRSGRSSEDVGWLALSEMDLERVEEAYRAAVGKLVTVIRQQELDD